MPKPFRSILSLAPVLSLWLLAGVPASGADASARYRVVFQDGRTIDVAEYKVESGRAILTLPEGGLTAFPAGRVERVEAIRPNPPQAPPPAHEATDPPAHSPVETPAPDVAPEAASDIESLIRRAAERYDLDIDLLAAVIAVESGYRADAVSPKGAQGLMQLMPATARELGVTDAFDPAQNIDAGARHLRRMLDDHDGVFWKALAAYNAGAGRVARYRGVPPYRETIAYVKRVLDRYKNESFPPERLAGDETP